MPIPLADLLGSVSELEHKGKTYRVRPPTQEEEGLFSRRLERRERENAARAVELDEADQAKLLAAAGRHAAIGTYEWGSDDYVEALSKPTGMAYMLYLVMRSENPEAGVTERLCREIVELNIRQVAALILAKDEPDPAKKKAILESVGLPANFLDSSSGTSSSSSSTPRTESPSSPSGE